MFQLDKLHKLGTTRGKGKEKGEGQTKGEIGMEMGMGTKQRIDAIWVARESSQEQGRIAKNRGGRPRKRRGIDEEWMGMDRNRWGMDGGETRQEKKDKGRKDPY